MRLINNHFSLTPKCGMVYCRPFTATYGIGEVFLYLKHQTIPIFIFFTALGNIYSCLQPKYSNPFVVNVNPKLKEVFFT